MKIFLSALENGNNEKILERKLLYNLMSYYYIKGKRQLAEEIRDKSELIMIAHIKEQSNWFKMVHLIAITIVLLTL